MFKPKGTVQIEGLSLNRDSLATIIKGSGRGQSLGLATINLRPTQKLSIKYGVYLASVKIKHQTHQGLLHFGPRPTFNEKEPSLEIYLQKHDPNVKIGLTVKIKLLKFRRKIQRFKTPKDLVKQMKKDAKILEEFYA